MWRDPIIEEVRKNREEFAARFNFDLQSMVRALQEMEKTSGRQMVSFVARPLVDHAESADETTVRDERKKEVTKAVAIPSP
ncbi:MAG: hypothetical protein HQL64_05385 [Magnetococcales bacterium]|nr:hypothetical protein [Magnetococcales bacterium]